MSDEAVHYMESTSRLRAENEKLRRIVAENRPVFDCAHSGARYASPCDDCPVQRAEDGVAQVSDEAVQGTGAYLTLAVESLESQLTAAETTMREVAEELRHCRSGETLGDLADRLDPRTP